MSTAQSNRSGRYSVTVDDSTPVAVDGFVNSQNPTCGFSFSARNLTNTPHTVVVTTLGPSAASGTGEGQANVEVDGFV
jgi:hypothetical protein